MSALGGTGQGSRRSAYAHLRAIGVIGSTICFAAFDIFLHAHAALGCARSFLLSNPYDTANVTLCLATPVSARLAEMR